MLHPCASKAHHGRSQMEMEPRRHAPSTLLIDSKDARPHILFSASSLFGLAEPGSRSRQALPLTVSAAPPPRSLRTASSSSPTSAAAPLTCPPAPCSALSPWICCRFNAALLLAGCPPLALHGAGMHPASMQHLQSLNPLGSLAPNAPFGWRNVHHTTAWPSGSTAAAARAATSHPVPSSLAPFLPEEKLWHAQPPRGRVNPPPANAFTAAQSTNFSSLRVTSGGTVD